MSLDFSIRNMSRDQTMFDYVTAHRDNVDVNMADKRALGSMDVLLHALVELHRKPHHRSDLRSKPVRYPRSNIGPYMYMFVSFGRAYA